MLDKFHDDWMIIAEKLAKNMQHKSDRFNVTFPMIILVRCQYCWYYYLRSVLSRYQLSPLFGAKCAIPIKRFCFGLVNKNNKSNLFIQLMHVVCYCDMIRLRCRLYSPPKEFFS